MEGMLQTTLAVLAGVCLYATVHHLWVGLQQPRQALHLLFALMCLLVSGYALNQINLYHADSPQTLVQFRHIQQTLAGLILGLLPWFVARYTGMRTGLPCRLLSLVFAGLILVHWIRPYGLYYDELPLLQHRVLPWGETIVDLSVGGNRIALAMAAAAVALVLAHAVYGCVRQFRQGVRRRAVMLAIALGLFFVSILLSIAVSAGYFNLMHTLEFGFVALIVVMSATLSGELHASRNALAASEARFRVLAEQATDAIYLHDTQGQIVDVNQQACRGLGYSRDELLRMRVADIEVEIGPAQIAAIWENMRPDTPVTVEGRHRRKDGTTFPVEVRTALFHADGRDFALAAARDIGARRQAETALRASEERLRATLDNTPGVAVQWYDRAGHVLYWNKASEQLYGVPAAQAMGKTLRDFLYTPEQFSGFLDAIAGIEKQGMPYGPAEIDMQNRQGEKICVIYTLFQIPGNVNEPIFVCMDVDISERKRAEAELQLHREHLEELVRARTDAMDVANRELEAFNYSVSHDLRSPLRAIDGFALALTEDCAGKLDATGQDYLQRIRGGTQRMAALIDAMLQLSRIGRKPLKPGSLDLSAMAREILAELAAAEPARQVAIDITPGLGAWGDAQLLHAALANLLGNAWKYSAKTPHAKITFGQMQQDGQTVYFVRDNGVGFDMAHAGKLFGAFQRLHHRAEFEGTGIGLATVQRIIHRHGGRIWAEAAPGQGATFHFTLPVQQPDIASANPPPRLP